METKTVGVVGAGIMGIGLAQSLAQSEFRVLLIDLNEEILERARHQIRSNLRLQTLLTKGTAGPRAGLVMNQITFSTDHRILEEADFLIENVVEKWEIKQRLYQQLDAICGDRTIFAANTSAISITRIASATRRPAQVLGMHFMNPVPLKRMVEVIRGYHTAEETIEAARRLLTRMEKECVVVNDSPGFVSNRVLMLTINEAIFLVQERVASAAEVDRIFKECFGHKMGPLETADLIGLDTILLSLEVLLESFSDSKYRPCPLLKQMVDAGLYGRKSGAGFYPYRTADQ
ncbi:MAG TPA: 3-hydroxyacyl-CoA dehydrogenase family protein [Blastocatellia bacterium]|nr:3-hydroxyacyl-CoA dehydrogenase family protein [Blastocatellia bacterium]